MQTAVTTGVFLLVVLLQAVDIAVNLTAVVLVTQIATRELVTVTYAS